MTVKELITILKYIEGDTEIIIQKDSEGNEYSPLSGADSNAVYVPDSTYSGHVYNLAWSAEDANISEDEWKQLKTNKKSLILYPIN